MFRRRALTSNEKIALALFGALSLSGLMGMLLGLLTPLGRAGTIEPQNAALCLGPFAGSLGAMALIGFRRRAGKPKPAFIGAIVAWFVGISLLGWGVFNAFNPGDNTVAANYGYAIALCFAPALIFTLLAILGYWHSELRETADSGGEPASVAARTGADDGSARGDAGYADIERRAADYRRQISAMVRKRKAGPLKDALLPALYDLDRWESRIRQLTSCLRVFDDDGIMQRDLQEVPLTIARLEAQLASERDAAVREQLEDTLAGYRAQQAQLDELRSAERRTRLELDEALSALGRVYSQLQLLAVKELDSASARSIAADIEAQTARLDDLLWAVTETYGGASARPRLDAAAGG